MNFFSIGYSGSDPLVLTAQARRDFDGLVCPKCRYLRVYDRGVDIDAGAGFEESRLNFVRGIQVGVIRTDFLDAIQGDRYLWLGSVYVEGIRRDDFRSFRGKHFVMIRGDSASSFWRCEVCRYGVYFPLGESRYVLADDVESDRVYQTELGTLLFPQTLMPIGFTEGTDLDVEEILVRGEPIDGQGSRI